MTRYTFQRGETIQVALDAVQGDPGQVDSITARMRLAVGGGAGVPFEIVDRAADGDIPAGWTLTIAAGVSAALPLGLYRADARLAVGDGVIITDPIDIRLLASPSGEAE
jgi:hypothetical protein